MASRIASTAQKKRKRRMFIGSAIIVCLVLLCALWFGRHMQEAARMERTDERLASLLKEKDQQGFQRFVSENGKPISMSEATRLINWLTTDSERTKRVVAQVKQDQAARKTVKTHLFTLKKENGWLWYDRYSLEVNPQRVAISSDVPGTKVTFDGEDVGTINEEPLVLKRAPGEYDIQVTAEQSGQAERASETIQVGDEETATVDFKLADRFEATVSNEYAIDIKTLLETEVKARTGKSIDTMTGYLGRSREAFENTFGAPDSTVANRARYDGYEVTYQSDRVQELLIRLNKTPEELEAIAGKPEEKKQERIGTIWEYPSSFLEGVFEWLNIRAEKRVIEREDGMWLQLKD
ncbi:TcaA second domain-containing protein [Exiguobacterium sp. TDN 0502]|uniref:TcaA second domain-containing protein n=1 Tax=Exiguobacterium sp. TDN 0502 TaxID=3420731 RepID=UPI003D770E65